MVVMTNGWTKKNKNNDNELGLSDDRYIYLYLEGDKAEWFKGFRADEGGAMAPGFNSPKSAYETIQMTTQPTEHMTS